MMGNDFQHTRAKTCWCFGWEAGIRSHSERAGGEMNVEPKARRECD
jgi:hypothetical protein